MKNIQALLLALVVTVLPVAPACSSIPLAPATQSQVNELEGQIAALKAAGATDEELAPLEAEVAALEAVDRQSWFSTTIAPVLGLIPGGAAAAPLLAPLVPLLFKRPRKHFGKAVLAMNPFDGGSVAPGKALESLLKMYGLKHSSESSEKAAEADLG